MEDLWETVRERNGKIYGRRKRGSMEDLWETPPFEAEISELSMVKNEINLAINNLNSWMKDEYVTKNLATTFDSAFIRKDPFGVVLIIGPWNYPVHLTLLPLVGAIAAGNCVIVKPSEISQHTERLLAEHLPRYLDKDCFAVICGGAEDTALILQNRFDYIFFTDSAINLSLWEYGATQGVPCNVMGTINSNIVVRISLISSIVDKLSFPTI
ncbi:hypothetical protein GDO86_020621 [Hymenochirus boettgeri]|uniref:Aldehyde dehydrogenase domain-containing protein n=1 Tax=Hymenochirus boettgeri TaxID=247094 RepID=A0A8T2IF01_9PIPI|nr:hypothetical protein GDO86_020621 [Hymenochirus boettgeri]